jgi:hypothetical protein
VTDNDEVFRTLCGPTLAATMRWNELSSVQLLKDSKVEKLMFDLYYQARSAWLPRNEANPHASPCDGKSRDGTCFAYRLFVLNTKTS